MFLSLVLSAAFPVKAATPPKLEIANPSPDAIALTAHDRSNGSWILQSSPDLKTWTNAGPVFEVRNSQLPFPLLAATGTARYFRLLPKAIEQDRSLEGTLDLPDVPYDYSAAGVAPVSIPRSATVLIDNNKALLGRVLFYDRRLSLDNSVSCASCHRQEHGFADPRRFSIGHVGVATTRNSQSLLHTRAYQGSKQLFWDGKASGLRSAVLIPVSHPDEMGTSITAVAAKLQHEPYYDELTLRAYGSPDLTPPRIAECLEDFIESLSSFKTRWDIGSQDAFRNFTSQENLGRSIFGSRCNSCHTSGAFSNGGFLNNGLDLVSLDPGLGGVTGRESDMGKFRVPSLRDVAVTPPYMHDGRFHTLREVIDHYSNGTQAHPNRPTQLADPMNFTESQKLALEAFLHTLTEEQAATNPAFSDPFRKDVGHLLSQDGGEAK